MLPLLQIMLEMLYWSVGNLEQNVAIAQAPRAAMTSIVPVWLVKKEELEVPVVPTRFMHHMMHRRSGRSQRKKGLSEP